MLHCGTKGCNLNVIVAEWLHVKGALSGKLIEFPALILGIISNVTHWFTCHQGNLAIFIHRYSAYGRFWPFFVPAFTLYKKSCMLAWNNSGNMPALLKSMGSTYKRSA